MIPTTETITIGAVFLYFVNEFFKYLKTRRANGRDFSKDVQDINLKIARIDLELSNDVSHLKGDVGKVQTDIALIKKDIQDIKIALKK